MGTRRRDAQRGQFSLAVEALEDRFLLSDAASVSIAVFTSEPTVLVAPAHHSSVGYELRSPTPQEVRGLSPAWQTTVYPLHLMMSYQRDDDGDNDLPGIVDRENSNSVFFGYPLFCFTGNHSAGCVDVALPAQSPELMASPTISLISFLPLMSAAGMGVTSISFTLPTPSATAAAENAPSNHDPSPSKEETRPVPAVPNGPRSAPPPLVQQPAEPPPSSSSGSFAELLLIDGAAIERAVDAFFQQLSNLSDEWRDGQVFEKMALWLLAASMAGYGWIRLCDRRVNRIADLLGCNPPDSVPTSILPGGEG